VKALHANQHLSNELKGR